jgi:hypothetical protein
LAAEAGLNRFTKSRMARRWLLPIGLLIFLAVTVVSFASLRNGVHLHWWAVGIVLAVTPLTVMINAAEYRVMGDINGHRIGWLSASRLTVFATAANLLPLPGGVLIRTQALRMRGSSYRHALLANAVAMLAWIGVGSVVIGALLLSTHLVAAIVLLVVGVGVVLACAVLLRGLQLASPYALLGRLLIIELVKVALNGVRIYFAFRCIGYTASPAQAVALTAANILAAAVGIFPSGLGLREGLAGLIGAAMSVSLAEAVATTAADRVISQVGLVIVVGMLLATGRRWGMGLQSLRAATTSDSITENDRGAGGRDAESGAGLPGTGPR